MSTAIYLTWMQTYLSADELNEPLYLKVARACKRMSRAALLKETDLGAQYSLNSHILADPTRAVWGECGSISRHAVEVIKAFGGFAELVNLDKTCTDATFDGHVAIRMSIGGRTMFLDPLYGSFFGTTGDPWELKKALKRKAKSESITYVDIEPYEAALGGYQSINLLSFQSIIDNYLNMIRLRDDIGGPGNGENIIALVTTSDTNKIDPARVAALWSNSSVFLLQ